MVNIAHAIDLAKSFTTSQGEVLPGIYYSYSAPIELPDCFYFHFTLVRNDGLSADVMVGGAPGFIIDKHTIEAKIIGWDEYHILMAES